MAFTITDIQEFSASVTFTDVRGNPAEIDGSPIWSVSNEELLGIETSNDEFTAYITALGPVGHAQVVVTADARIGEETSEIKGILDIDIVASEAVSATITPSEPTDMPE